MNGKGKDPNAALPGASPGTTVDTGGGGTTGGGSAAGDPADKKTDAKPDAKAQTQTQAGADAKARPDTDAKPEPDTGAPGADAKPEPDADAKPEPGTGAPGADPKRGIHLVGSQDVAPLRPTAPKAAKKRKRGRPSKKTKKPVPGKVAPSPDQAAEQAAAFQQMREEAMATIGVLVDSGALLTDTILPPPLRDQEKKALTITATNWALSSESQMPPGKAFALVAGACFLPRVVVLLIRLVMNRRQKRADASAGSST